MYIEDFSGITPWLATACKIPRDADDDYWIRAVIIVPANTPRKGF